MLYGLRDIPKPEEEAKSKPKVNYALDTSNKDLRGPAQAALLGPSNKIMFRSMFCVALCVFSFGVAVWPFVFSEDILDYKETLKAYFKIEVEKQRAILNSKKNFLNAPLKLIRITRTIFLPTMFIRKSRRGRKTQATRY